MPKSLSLLSIFDRPFLWKEIIESIVTTLRNQDHAHNNANQLGRKIRYDRFSPVICGVDSALQTMIINILGNLYRL
jgi:hypothetical protein